MLARAHEFLLFFVAIGAFLAAIEAGFRLGLRHHRPGDTGSVDHAKALQTALLGLLALLLGFNFAMAASRFDARKALIQDEVNAISTAWLRAQLMPEPARSELSGLVKAYVLARIDFMRAGTDEGQLDAAGDEASVVEDQLWKMTGETVQTGVGTAQLTLFVQALNDVVNVKWKRRAVLDNHVPEPVLYLLFAVAIGALGFIGYGYGLTGRRRHVSTAIFALLIAVVLTTILDFDRPRGGFIRVSEEGLTRLQATLDYRKP